MSLLAILIFVGTIVLSLWATMRVRQVYSKFSLLPASARSTGAETAVRILQQEGIYDVEIVEHDQALGDHYDPTHKRLVLSRETFHGTSVAAQGVAAHECGHAIQHKEAYAPLVWRMASVGLTMFASQIVLWLPLLGMFTGFLNTGVALILVASAWGILMLFNLITLSVEFYPGLQEAVQIIIGFLESPAAQQAKDPLPRWMAETGFAAGYFLKRFDLIPDHVAEIGLADDVLILQRVVRRNQSELIPG